MGWRTLSITDEALVCFNVKPEARGTLKRMFTYGYHEPEDGRGAYTVGEQYLPDDAVLSEPEYEPLIRLVRYHVISDEFSEEQNGEPITPVCYTVPHATPTT